MEQEEKFILSEAAQSRIDHWLQKYPINQQRSAVVEALFIAQEENNNWLSEAAMNAVADYLDIPRIAVYEAATFYDMFNLKPIAKHKIAICTNISCMLRGSDRIVDCLEKRLNTKLNQSSADGLFALKEVECMAACVSAPMCQVDDKEYYVNLTEEKILSIVDELIQRGE